MSRRVVVAESNRIRHDTGLFRLGAFDALRPSPKEQSPRNSAYLTPVPPPLNGFHGDKQVVAPRGNLGDTAGWP